MWTEMIASSTRFWLFLVNNDMSADVLKNEYLLEMAFDQYDEPDDMVELKQVLVLSLWSFIPPRECVQTSKWQLIGSSRTNWLTNSQCTSE